MKRSQIELAHKILSNELIAFKRKPRSGAKLEALQLLEQAVQALEILLLRMEHTGSERDMSAATKTKVGALKRPPAIGEIIRTERGFEYLVTGHRFVGGQLMAKLEPVHCPEENHSTLILPLRLQPVSKR